MLTLHREVEIMIQTIITADTDIIKSILAILTLLYAIIRLSKPVLLFVCDVFRAVDYTIKVINIVCSSVAYGVT